MSNNDFFEEIKKEERRRFRKSIKKAREAVLVSRFPHLHDKTLKEIRDYERLLDQLQGLLSLGVDEFYKHLPSPLEEIRERSSWEVYLAGLMYLCRRFPRGFFRKVVLALEEWEDFPDKVDAYSEKCLEGYSDFVNLAQELKRYCEYYKKGREIVQEYGEWHKDIWRLYASLKTWEKDSEFQTFEDYLRTSQRQFFEVIIEGPIQLYLFIGEETWFFILKILTIENLGDFFSDKDRKELRDLRDIHKFWYNLIKHSESFETFKKFVKETLKIYVDDYLEEEKRLRSQYPTTELRKKFIRRFESGELFKKSS